MNLVMLTKFFPFGMGETFIENEINILSRYYDKILIIACEAPCTSVVRDVPPNVVVRKVAGVSSCGKIWDALKGQWWHISSDKDFVEERNSCKTIKQKLFLGYFEEKCQRVYRTIIRQGLLTDFAQGPFVLYSYWLFMTARVATLINQGYNVPYMFCRAHGYDLYAERNSTNYLPYRDFFLRTFNRIFPCSANGEQYLQERYPAYKDKICASLLGTIDYGLGHQSEDGVFRIVSCSRIVPIKRVERIIDALTLLESKGINIEWTHIGGGQGLNGILKKAKSKLHRIKYIFMGDVPNADVLKIYKTKPFDLFLNVSSSEGLPVSIMEAISFGMPVVATDVGGTSEIVQADVTGHVLPADFNNEALADGIGLFYHMKESSDEYQNYRERCRSFWEEHFQAVNNYNKLYKFIQKEIENKAK